jgi:ATP-dependent Lon protease
MPSSTDKQKRAKARKSRAARLAEMAKQMSKKRNDSGPGDGSDNESASDEAGKGKFDMKEYREMLAEMFPSKHARAKAEATPSSDGKPARRSKRLAKKKKEKENVVLHVEESEESEADEEIEESEEEASPPKKRSSRRSGGKRKAKRTKRVVELDSEEESEDDDEDSDASSVDTDEAMEGLSRSGFNIVFVVGQDDEDESEDEDWSEDEDESEDEDYSEDEEEDEEEETENDGSGEESGAESPKDKSGVSNKDALEKIKAMVDAMPEDMKSNPVCKSMVEQYEKLKKAEDKKAKKRTRKARNKNAKDFKGMLKDKNVMNDMQYFKKKLSPEEQRVVIKQLEEVKTHCSVSKPYRLQLLGAEIPSEYKAVAYKKVSMLKYMEPGGGEYYKLKQWVDTFMQIPFGSYKSLPVTITDGVEKCNEFMANATQTLDDAVYGLNDAKYQVMQLVGQWISNPGATGTAIAIKGPMGTGKTTLVKDGISKILGRDFAFIALGGATDSSFLEGHSYTYEGAVWGKIVDILVQSKSMNPVIFLDELDKVSATPKGEEIIGILTHLTDTTQNSKFHDKYFAELDFDLSRCLFIFSYNDENLVNPILRDRMYRVETTGYDSTEKTVIANKYLLPKIREQVKIEEGMIVIPDETIKHIISTYTEDEKGVRNLKRCLEIIYTKLNLYRLMKPGSELFSKAKSLEVKFPMTVTSETVDKLINKKEDKPWLHGMYI